MNISLKAFVALLFLLHVLPLQAENNPSTQKGNLKIGAILAMTGPAQAWGKYARMGAELALDDQNKTGGINGRQIEMIVEDSRSASSGAVTAYKKLTTLDKVDVIVGDVWTQLVDPLIPLSTRDKIPLIAPAVVPISVKPGPFFFTMGHNPDLAEKAVAKFFELNARIKKVAIFCWDNPWGASYLQLWKREIVKRRIKITNEVCTSDFGYDYRADVAKLTSTMPDAIIVSHQAERIVQRIAEVRLAPIILTTSNIVEVFTDRTLAPSLAEGIYFTDWSGSTCKRNSRATKAFSEIFINRL